MPPVYLLTIAIFAPLGLGLAGLLLPRRAIGLRVLLAVLGPVIALLLLGNHVAQHGVDQAIEGVAWMPDLRLNLELNPDRLGLFFAFLVSGVGLLIVLYARAYFGPDADALYRFYPSLLLFMTAMIGVALADNLMLLLLFWEMTSISSFLLIGWERDDPHAVRNAMQAFIVTGLGGLVLMGGLILIGITTGAWSFTELHALATTTGLPTGPLLTAAFIMIFIGAAAKSAQWPLHFWLPGAMAAPTPVSAYLHSATMVKAGVYLTGRLWPILALAIPLWPQLIAPIGALTMILGAYIALRKSDLKQIFAYTTVSQLGLLMCMYGLGHWQYHDEPNVIWDITQILNHALYKAPLFLIAGAIAHVAHTRELPELRGLFHTGPGGRLMTILLLLAAYAMAAGPLTLSFPAKEFFFYGIWHAYEASGHPLFWLLIAAGVATGAFNVAIFLRLARTLLGTPHIKPPQPPHPPGHDIHGQHDYDAPLAHPPDAHPHETGPWPAFLWIPAAAIVAFQYLGGLWPAGFEVLFGTIERSRHYFDHLPSALYLLTHPGPPLYMSLAGFALGIALGLAPLFKRVIRDIHDDLYPAFYTLVTRGGGWIFSLIQTGHVRTYIAAVTLAIVGLTAWAIYADPTRTPGALRSSLAVEMEHPRSLLPGYLLTALVCGLAILMPIVKSRASRVLVLGAIGFAVTGVFYLYNAPDLALTQISIEIVALVLFLLVLSLLPRAQPTRTMAFAPRLIISLALGIAMFWLALTSSVGVRPYLGEFFLRNSYHAVDVEHHKGGGGNNVVNVILVDFRGLDTLGEITVLALAAIGVWTLLRRRSRRQSTIALRRNLGAGTGDLPPDLPDRPAPQPHPELSQR
jgi:NADH:ubiquinone oxidoreductase subunit 5 (subunit L)/multisubunit Na+/H+ antiporter MnhA subunit